MLNYFENNEIFVGEGCFFSHTLYILIKSTLTSSSAFYLTDIHSMFHANYPVVYDLHFVNANVVALTLRLHGALCAYKSHVCT